MNRRVVITGIGVVSPNGIGTGNSGARRGRAQRHRPDHPFRHLRFRRAGGRRGEGFREEDYIAPKDRPHVSRVAPLAIAAVEEALESAGLDPFRMTRDELRQIGVMVGSGGGSQEFTEEQYRLYYTGHWRQCSVYIIPTSTIGTLASEVSMRFGFRGLSHVISTGCTSSTDAIGYAFRHIQIGRAGHDDGGRRGCAHRAADPARVSCSCAFWHALERQPERASRPFSRDRDGFVIAEGAWFFVLEEREQARARGATIYRRDRRLRLHLRSLPPRAPGGVRRGAGARHRHWP